MKKASFAWLTYCILFGSITFSTVSFSKVSQAQSGRANRQLDGPETTVAKFHQALQNRNFDSLDQYYCSIEKAAARQIERGRSKTAVNTYLKLSSAIYSIDTSRLYYETKYYDPKLGRAIVAITGNIILKSSNGRTAVVPYRRFSTLGRDWLRLINENNQWKLCYNLTKPPR